MIDLVRITVRAGNGGDGIVSFRREKFVPKGGPDGGPGGKGGDIYLVADQNLVTLKDFQQRKHFKAEDGKRGGSARKTGRGGEDLYLKVPVGTIIRESTVNRAQSTEDRKRVKERFQGTFRDRLDPDPGTEELGSKEPASDGSVVADLIDHSQTILTARGGEGGRGNTSFRSSKNRTPRQFGKGKPGEERILRLELKLIADVGLIGLPNAGKSTLLNALTSARAQVADYPFTTLEPNLGVMGIAYSVQGTAFKDNFEKSSTLNARRSTLVLADIPGLIEGASKGRGLGDEFLRHIERTRILVHLIDISDPTMGPLGAYRTIRKELGDYSPELLKKPEIVVFSKIDLDEAQEALAKGKKVFSKQKIDVLEISSETGEGLDKLKKRIAGELERAKDRSQGTFRDRLDSDPGTKVFHLPDLPNKRMVFRKRVNLT